MGLLDFFRRKPPIRDAKALADFIDEQAAFLVQKGIYDYSRARSGHFAKVMLADKGFQSALNRSRWQAFPLGPCDGGRDRRERAGSSRQDGDRAANSIALIAALCCRSTIAIRSRRSSAADDWERARRDLALHLRRIAMHPPKRIIDIPLPFAEPISR